MTSSETYYPDARTTDKSYRRLQTRMYGVYQGLVQHINQAPRAATYSWPMLQLKRTIYRKTYTERHVLKQRISSCYSCRTEPSGIDQTAYEICAGMYTTMPYCGQAAQKKVNCRREHVWRWLAVGLESSKILQAMGSLPPPHLKHSTGCIYALKRSRPV